MPMSETLLLTWFLWLVIKEAPETAWSYLVFFDRLRARRGGNRREDPRTEGRRGPGLRFEPSPENLGRVVLRGRA